MAKSKKPSTGSNSTGNSGNVLQPIKGMVKYCKTIFIFLLTQFGEGVQKSGRAGGVVIQKNGVQRQFRAPATRNTPATGFIRGLFSSLQTGFTALGQDIQKAWNSDNFRYIDRLARNKKLGGRQAYVRINTYLTITGQANLVNPPSSVHEAPPVLDGVLTADDSAHTLSLAYTPTASGIAYVMATPPLRASIFKPNLGQYKLIGFFDSGASSPVDLTAQYDVVFGTDAVTGIGRKIFTMVVNVSNTGSVSRVDYDTQIVA